MFLQQDVDLLPKTFDQVTSIETRLLVVVFVVLLVCHAHALICRILGVPENWIKLLIRMMATWF